MKFNEAYRSCTAHTEEEIISTGVFCIDKTGILKFSHIKLLR